MRNDERDSWGVCCNESSGWMVSRIMRDAGN